MKKIVLIIFYVFIVFALMLFNQKKLLYKEGTYTGRGQGHHGEIKVEVITNKYKIKKIKIIEQQETPELCDIVYDTIPERIIKYNSVDVNAVAGASFTSHGLLDAVKNALEKAKIKKR
ncbi:FMN-binding protein [Clostridium ganghwense]|uniref:FMN-binding protein n=1 Tax=Clostridium ganghwense TaxID=312089 RepID=A0ABT4CWX2_9CLOT|nr:FMN-binding protein [Clostridium ganghwense]MCY6372671.1 FMN-binding protein [Clostridium ganghwense]